MDAAEADADVKLYKASSELLLELRAKVPRLVRNENSGNALRKWVIKTKIYEVTHLLDRFQEWPQLLDPYLADLIQLLVDAYLSYCISHPQEYLRHHDLRTELSPLPQAVAEVLYAFCKVRGRKVIVRLLNNEPKYVEPLLSCFRLWTSQKVSEGHGTAAVMSWQERYIHLLWLSHLMLAPFELSTISMLSVDASNQQTYPELYINLPIISVNLAMAGLDDLCVPSKAREAACILLVKLSLRRDMQQIGLPKKLVDWAINQLQLSSNHLLTASYRYIGLLALVFGIVNSASTSETEPFLDDAFQLACAAANSVDAHFISVRDSAPARKLLIKIMRSSVIHAITADNSLASVRKRDLGTMLEDCIQSLLDFLADKDTPVRQAASKALSLICLKLDDQMSTEIVEAVIESLNENLLLEDVTSGRLFPITDISKDASVQYRKNLNAVDPLRWHGCMLTLGHLLFRRSLSISQLPTVVNVLLMGLDFEQRSNVGTSIGVAVRDAACFGVWSLARKYSTTELNQTTISSAVLPAGVSFSGVTTNSTLQVIATSLALSACLDPSGNLRRGSSAALQELIGRHPDVIAEGIPVVQTIDYHSVARRSRAITEIVVEASKLSPYYHGPLLYALVGWRGARATDADSRRQAAQAVRSLISLTSTKDIAQFLSELVLQIKQLKLSNTGSNAQNRHGLLYCLAAVMENIPLVMGTSNITTIFDIISPVFEDLASATGTLEGRVTVDMEYVLEAISMVVLASTSIATSLIHVNSSNLKLCSSDWAESVLPILGRCIISSDKEFVTDIAAQAAVDVLKLLCPSSQERLLSSWLDKNQQSKLEYTCKGRIATLSLAYNYLKETMNLLLFPELIIAYMSNIIHSPFPIETKVTAMQGITTILITSKGIEKHSYDSLVAAIHSGLMDYTVDQRGDVGSLLRLESIEAAKQLLCNGAGNHMQRTLQLIVRLAAERLVKVRFEAWKCLSPYLSKEDSTLLFEHQADVSSFNYFSTIIDLLKDPRYQESLLVGLISSICLGTEDVTRACIEALTAYIHRQNEIDRHLMIASVLKSIVRHTSNLNIGDDRDIIPVIEFLALMIEQIIALQSNIAVDSEFQLVWEMCQRMHTTSSTMTRLEAMIRLYSAMALISSSRLRALDKLTRLLLHRWPKIRAAAADTILLYTPSDPLILCDWNAPVAENKPKVLTIRKELNVAGANATNTVQRIVVDV